MKMKAVAMGNAVGGAASLMFLLCAVVAYPFPAFAQTIFRSLAHSVTFDPLIPANEPPFDFGMFLLGWVFITFYCWVLGWLIGAIYNWSTKESSTYETDRTRHLVA